MFFKNQTKKHMFILDGLKTYIALFLFGCWGVAFIMKIIDAEVFLGGLTVLGALVGLGFRSAIKKTEVWEDFGEEENE